MKRLLLALLLFALLAIPSHARYNYDGGFTQYLDVGAGYGVKFENVLVDVGYNLGYTFPFGLYIGAGPTVMAGTLVEDWYPSYCVGGYGKLCYTVVQMNTSAQPYVEARGGYIYNIKSDSGNAIFGVGIGVRFKERFRLGAYLNMEPYKETYLASSKHMTFKTRNAIEKIPTIIFSYQF